MFRKPILIACFAVLLTTAVVGGAATPGVSIAAQPQEEYTMTVDDNTVNATFLISNERERGQARTLTVNVTNASPELNVTQQSASIEKIGANNTTIVSFPVRVSEGTPDGNYSVNISVYQGDRELANSSYTVWVHTDSSSDGGSSGDGESSSGDEEPGETDDNESAAGGGGGFMVQDRPWYVDLYEPLVPDFDFSGWLDGLFG